MRKSKAIQLLGSLKPSELDRLHLYAQSPYCNPNKNALQLLEKIRIYYPEFNSDALEKKRFFKKLYPKKTFNEAYLRKQLSGLYQMTKSFLATEEWNQREDLQQRFLLRQLQARELPTIFQIHFDQFTRELKERPQRDGDFFYHAYQLATEADRFFDQSQSTEQEAALQTKVDHLDTFYLLQKLKESCEMINRNQSNGTKFRLHLVKELVAFLEADPVLFGQSSAISIYLQVLKMLVYQKDPEHYFTLTELLSESGQCFSPSELGKINQYAEDYCLRQIRQGNKAFLHHLFDFYQRLLNQGLAFINGHLPEEIYQKILNLSFGLQQFDWAEQFIYDYRHQLSAELQDNIFHFQLASLHYHKGQYTEVIDLLRSTRFSNIQYEINGQYLLLKTYFDADQLDHLQTQLEDFNLRLMRVNSLSTQEKQAVKNFIVLLKRIIQLYTSTEQWTIAEYEDKKQKIRDRLDQVDPIFKGKWLKEIFSELA